MHDDYKRIECAEDATLAPCPVCGSKAEMWQFSESETDPTSKLVCCSRGDPFGPQVGLVHAGCLLYMPPQEFYCSTKRDAVKYWNEYAAALIALRGGV